MANKDVKRELEQLMKGRTEEQKNVEQKQFYGAVQLSLN